MGSPQRILPSRPSLVLLQSSVPEELLVPHLPSQPLLSSPPLPPDPRPSRPPSDHPPSLCWRCYWWCYWICWFRCFFDHQRCWICCLIHRILHHLWHQQPLFCWRKRLKLPCFCWVQHLLCCLISCLRCNCHRRNLHLFRWWCSSNRHGRYGWSCRSRRPRPINQPTNLISPCAYDRFPTRVCCIIRKEKGTGKHLGGDV